MWCPFKDLVISLLHINSTPFTRLWLKNENSILILIWWGPAGVLTVLQLQYEVSPSPTDGSERGCEGGEGILFGLFMVYFGCFRWMQCCQPAPSALAWHKVTTSQLLRTCWRTSVGRAAILRDTGILSWRDTLRPQSVRKENNQI